jgi:hypothetical protein
MSSNLCSYPAPGEIFKPDSKQQALTQEFIEPHLTSLSAALNLVRDQVDLRLKPEYEKNKTDHPYPYGYCLQLTNEVLKHIEDSHFEGVEYLAQFKQAGGYLDRIWGDLRGEYFQNAIQAGTLYIDVANDTVDVNKPRVEILHLEQSGFANFTSYSHYAKIGTLYHKTDFYPNVLFPRLAPMFPLLSFDENKGWAIKPTNAGYFICKNILANLDWAENVFNQNELIIHTPIEGELAQIWAQFNKRQVEDFSVEVQLRHIQQQTETARNLLHKLGATRFRRQINQLLPKITQLNKWLYNIHKQGQSF